MLKVGSLLSVSALALAAPIVSERRLDCDCSVPELSTQSWINHAPIAAISGISDEAAALDLFKQQLPESTFTITDLVPSGHNGVTHMYVRQTINNLPVYNSVGNANILRGQVLSMAESFYKGAIPTPTKPRVTLEQAVNAFADHAGLKMPFNWEQVSLEKIESQAVYVQNTDGSLSQGIHFVIKREYNWFDVVVSSDDLNVLFCSDWAHESQSYNVYPLGVNDPEDGPRANVTGVYELSRGSPLGWHDIGNGNTNTTVGNNVNAIFDSPGSPTYQPFSDDGLYDYPIDLSQDPEEYRDAALTNLFYWNNVVHDIFYNYGFDEESGNMQTNNFENGGLGNDAVYARGQFGPLHNNAVFSAPPDGREPSMSMFLWNLDDPRRDGDLENGIIVHEYGHGINIRLAGGPSNSNCMSGGEAGGMGEGWGDYWSILLRWRSEYSRDLVVNMGAYVYQGRTIRKFPYSYDMITNPATYSYVGRADYGGVHDKGFVWCTIMYDLFLDIVEKYGFDEDWYTGSGASNAVMQNTVDALKLQVCNPDFVQTRDAFLMAETINHDDMYKCDYWRAFARRGLGEGASRGGGEDFTVPAECR